MADRRKMKRGKGEGGIRNVIVLDNVNIAYSDANGVPALMDINLKIQKGEFVFIVGDSGSGKSTLIKLLLRELTADSGRVIVNGYDLGKMHHRQVPKFRRGLGVVFQDFRLLKDRNVDENVACAERIVMKREKDIRKDVPNMLSMVGLAGKYKAKPKQLSGGEQQRVAIARALAHRPRLILADEPTAELDSAMAVQIAKLFTRISAEEGISILMTTHDVGLMGAADMIIELENGERIDGGRDTE